MTRINVKAVSIATVSMFFLDLLSSVLLLPLFSDTRVLESSNAEQIEQALTAMTLNVGYLICTLISGTLTTILGGYLAARIAKIYPYFNAAAFGVVAIAIGCILSNDAPLWFDIIGYLSTLPAAIYGGHLAKQAYSAKP